jgi:hypothetical protein
VVTEDIKKIECDKTCRLWRKAFRHYKAVVDSFAMDICSRGLGKDWDKSNGRGVGLPATIMLSDTMIECMRGYTQAEVGTDHIPPGVHYRFSILGGFFYFTRASLFSFLLALFLCFIFRWPPIFF